MNRLGFEMLTTMGLPPVDHVTLAADMGCAHVSLMMGQLPVNPYGHPPFDLIGDAPLRREVKAALNDRGVTPSLGEGFVLMAGADFRDTATPQFEPMLDLGIRRINVVSMDPDVARSIDQFAVLADLALAAGIDEVVCEYAPCLTIRDLPMALAAIAHVNRPEFKLLVDTMHHGRTGGTAEDLARLDPAMIGYVQLADAPLASDQDYMQEAMTDRKYPGEGELPLAAFLSALPRDLVVSLEVPQLAKALAGQDMVSILRPMADAARELLARTA